MPVNIVAGGEFGSEGKGKATAYLAENRSASIVVRCGGPNSGHTVQHGDRRTVLRHLPAGFHLSTCRLLIASGAYIDLDLLFDEIKHLGLNSQRIGISPYAGVIESRHKEQEFQLSLKERIGSTLSGTGAAVSERVLRSRNFRLAKDIPSLKPFLAEDVTLEVSQAAERGETVLIEGTQGFGLSLLHSPYFPYATSRDTTAAGFCSEVGVSPALITDVTLVFRSYPIRVGGESGPFRDEISWEEITERCGSPEPIVEFTTVTGRVRKVAEFDIKLAKLAIEYNKPTVTVLNHIDYVNFADRGKSRQMDLSEQSLSYIARLEKDLGISFDLIGTGPDHEDVVDKTSVTSQTETLAPANAA